MSLFGRIYNTLLQTRADVTDPAPVITPRRALGDKGEEHALSLLRQRGHKYVTRNWSCKSGELDLITWHKNTLVFTEVRTRSSTEFGTPAESVNPRKQERMRRAAHWYLSKHYRDGHLPSCRYDVVWILARDGEIADSGVIEGAFC
jgi:putative endonuclease